MPLDYIPHFNASVRVPEKFDPYSKWLSIPAGRRPPDYYQLLGLAPLESDLFRIVTSADRQIGRVLPHLAGDEAKAAKALLDELLKAKGYLITPAAKILYDKKLRKRLEASDSPEDAALLDMLASSPPAEVRPRTRPTPAAPPTATPPASQPPTAAPLAHDAEAPPVVAPPSPPRMASEGVARATLVAAPGAAFAVAAPTSGATGVMMATAARQSPGDDFCDEPLPEPVIAPAQDPDEELDSPRFDSRRLARDFQRRGSWVGPTMAFVVALATVGVVGGIAWQQGFRLQLVSADSGQTRLRDEAIARDNTVSRSWSPTQTGSNQSAPMSPVQRTSNETMSDSAPSATAQPGEEAPVENQMPPPDATPPAAKPRPTDASDAKPAMATTDPLTPAPPDAAMALKLKETLALAREALAARDLAAADKQLSAAAVEATSPELLARVEAVRRVRDYVDGFWKAVRESTKTLKGGEEFTVRDKVIAIVDANPDRIVLRAAGQNREYKMSDLPPHMATALAERWLDQNDANSKVFVGAFWMVDPKMEPGLAREKLMDAANAGAKDAAAIAKLLDAPW